MRLRLCILWALLTVASATVNATDALEGRLAQVFDGDTIAVLVNGKDLRLRLHAIDTPDQEQELYDEAGDQLRKLIDDRPLRIVLVAKTYGRQAAIIFVDDTDINAELIRTGYAYAHRKYLGLSQYDRRYCALEHEARSAGAGLWSLKPQDRIAPWQLRQSYRGDRSAFTDFSTETSADCNAAAGKEDTRAGTIATDPLPGLQPPNPDCPIKGDITFTGKRRYYVPGTRSYPSILINEVRGERWFCSEADALEAGWQSGR